MKRFLMVVGTLTVVVVGGVALGLVLYAPEGRRLDASSRDYASHVVETAMKDWDASALRAESSEELLASAPEDKVARMLGAFSTRLGPIRTHAAPQGESHLSMVPFKKVVTADYIVPVTFEKAEGRIKLRLVQKQGEWKLLSVYVDSPALLP